MPRPEAGAECAKGKFRPLGRRRRRHRVKPQVEQKITSATTRKPSLNGQ